MEKISPSGPCTLGGGVMCFFILFITSIVLFLKSIYKTIKIGKSNFIVMLLHMIAISAVLISIYVSGNK
ncbi:MAG TPA: hypothetical protein DGG95_13875 [Cytophagales bacterium]|nr:hypothetical protein [Cytophagales bacterium]